MEIISLLHKVIVETDLAQSLNIADLRLEQAVVLIVETLIEFLKYVDLPLALRNFILELAHDVLMLQLVEREQEVTLEGNFEVFSGC